MEKPDKTITCPKCYTEYLHDDSRESCFKPKAGKIKLIRSGDIWELHKIVGTISTVTSLNDDEMAELKKCINEQEGK